MSAVDCDPQNFPKSQKCVDKDILKMSGWPSEDNRIGEVSEKVETATNHFVKTLALQMRTLPTSS
jgi:hypothetical protein